MSIETLKRDHLPTLAYHKIDAQPHGAHLPTVIFCGGFRSDMEGTKATYLQELCAMRGQAYIRFDYSGHGQSEGLFEDGTIGSWAGDTSAIVKELTTGDVLLIGSSMGGWISFLIARDMPEKIKALIGIAAAPDFTREIRDEQFTPAQKQELKQQGFVKVPNEYSDEPYIFTKKLFDDGDQHCLLDRPLNIECPVTLLQGMKDNAVPWQKAHRIKNAMTDPDLCEVILIESGDHSLSRAEDLELLKSELIKRSAT